MQEGVEGVEGHLVLLFYVHVDDLCLHESFFYLGFGWFVSSLL